MEDRRSWTEIDLGVLKHNYGIYKAAQAVPGTRIMAVVKADAYGHGALEVARTLAQVGVMDYAVATVDEAVALRTAGIQGQILVLGYTPADQMRRIYDNGITQTLLSKEYAALVAGQGLRIKAQFAIDTGMHRIGLDAGDLDGCEKVIRQYASQFELTGCFTHLCIADTDTAAAQAFTHKQISAFNRLAKRLADMKMPYMHCMNSIGGLRYSSNYNDMVRLGVILYGLRPDYANILPDGIQPVLSWKSVVSMVKVVKANETVGYGRTYTAAHAMTVATVSTGYADGFDRRLSNNGFVLVNGQKAPVIGRVCMDQFMIDVTNVTGGIGIDTTVTILGTDGRQRITADDMAHMIGTIGYEVVCGITPRVTRVYIG